MNRRISSRMALLGIFLACNAADSQKVPKVVESVALILNKLYDMESTEKRSDTDREVKRITRDDDHEGTLFQLPEVTLGLMGDILISMETPEGKFYLPDGKASKATVLAALQKEFHIKLFCEPSGSGCVPRQFLPTIYGLQEYPEAMKSIITLLCDIHDQRKEDFDLSKITKKERKSPKGVVLTLWYDKILEGITTSEGSFILPTTKTFIDAKKEIFPVLKEMGYIIKKCEEIFGAGGCCNKQQPIATGYKVYEPQEYPEVVKLAIKTLCNIYEQEAMNIELDYDFHDLYDPDTNKNEGIFLTLLTGRTPIKLHTPTNSFQLPMPKDLFHNSREKFFTELKNHYTITLHKEIFGGGGPMMEFFAATVYELKEKK